MLRPNQRGLTLIEVMVSLGVLIILVGGIFMVVQTSLRTVILIDERASREDEVTNLLDILRSNFRTLPAHARLSAAPVSGNGFEEMLVVVQNAPGFLSWMARQGADNEVVLLSFRQDAPQKRWRLCLKRFEPEPGHAPTEWSAGNALKAAAELPWLELVSDFEAVSLRFFDRQHGKWLNDWSTPGIRPGLIELTLAYEHPKDERSSTALFWLPPVKGGEG